MGLLHLVCLAGLAACVHGNFANCFPGTKIEKVIVNNVDVSGKVAILKQGTNATLRIVFTPAIGSTTSTSKCYGIIAGVPVPFPVPSNGCEGMSPKCPIKPKTTYTYTTVIPVKKLYPKVSVFKDEYCPPTREVIMNRLLQHSHDV